MGDAMAEAEALRPWTNAEAQVDSWLSITSFDDAHEAMFDYLELATDDAFQLVGWGFAARLRRGVTDLSDQADGRWGSYEERSRYESYKEGLPQNFFNLYILYQRYYTQKFGGPYAAEAMINESLERRSRKLRSLRR